MAGKIEHVIVLLMENRSFDHMLGYLDHPNPGEYPGLTGNEVVDGVQVSSTAPYEVRSPDHSHRGVMQQLFGEGEFDEGWLPSRPYPEVNTNRGFVRNYYHRCGTNMEAARIMRCFHPELIPVLSGVAREYAVCTRWFCSLPGETWPNRDFAVAARSFGKVNQAYQPRPTTRTIFHRLDAANASWRIYHDSCAHTWLYTDLLGRGRFKGMDRLVEDIRNDTLPTYAYIEPDYGLGSTNRWADVFGYNAVMGDSYGNSQHPSQAHTRLEFIAGEYLIAGIYNALVDTMLEAEPGKEHESVFAKTIFLVTYDEHGGFYDRERPPTTQQPTPWDVYQEHNGYEFEFTLLGPRVPAIVISPWIPRGTIVGDRHFDHSSIPATVRKLFARNQLPLTARDENAETFESLLGDTLRTPESADPIRRIEPLIPAFAFDNEDLYADNGNPADRPETDFKLRESLLWLAREMRREMDDLADPAALDEAVELGAAPGDHMVELDPGSAEHEERLAREVVERMHDE